MQSGYYWIKQKINADRPPVIGYCDGEDWQFVGGLFIIDKEEFDEKFFIIGGAIEPPAVL